MKTLSNRLPNFLIAPRGCSDTFICDADGLLDVVQNKCPHGIDSVKIFVEKNSKFQRCSKADILKRFAPSEQETLQQEAYFKF
jgi:hypothetical protein